MIRRIEMTCLLAFAVPLLCGAAPAAKFKLLHSFGNGRDGEYPEASLVRDNAGNLYGTTEDGGDNGAGTIFKLAPGGGETVLYSFDGPTGANPTSSLIIDKAGNLYGTTYNGGTDSAGTVFQLAPDGTETVLYSFRNGSDGGTPYAGVIRKSGVLYGTTEKGGVNGNGVVFAVSSDGTETALHAFVAGKDGSYPLGAVLADKADNLYGTTYLGGTNNLGIVYRIATDGTETVLHTFGGGSDGAKPAAALIADESGNLYGTTVLGGANNAGTVFKLAPDGHEHVLYSFSDGSEGADPMCSLVRDSRGNLYGTTPVAEGDGAGAVFRLAKDGAMSVLYSFAGANGAAPDAGLVADANGHLYGTTPYSGTYGYGVVFRLNE